MKRCFFSSLLGKWTSVLMLNLNTSWFRRTSGSNRTLLTLLHGALLLLCLGAEDFNRAQDLSKKSSQQTGDPASAQKSEFIAPGIEHIQIIRGHKSEKEATGP